MSNPQADIIHVKGERYSLYSQPLQAYWQLHNNEPMLISTMSGNNRGYIATWLIEDNRLYLIDFWGETMFSPGYKEYSMQDLFPDVDRVFAEWYTGQLTIGIGELLDDLPIRQYQVKADVRDGVVGDLSMQDTV